MALTQWIQKPQVRCTPRCYSTAVLISPPSQGSSKHELRTHIPTYIRTRYSFSVYPNHCVHNRSFLYGPVRYIPARQVPYVPCSPRSPQTPPDISPSTCSTFSFVSLWHHACFSCICGHDVLSSQITPINPVHARAPEHALVYS